MTSHAASSLVIPEFPSLDKQRLTMALRAFSALAQGRLDEAEQCLDALALRPEPASPGIASMAGAPVR